MKRTISLACLVAAIFVATNACTNKQPALSSGIDVKGMDTAIAAGDNFDEYTNGGWFKANPIPADKSSWGLDAMLADQTRQRVKEIIESTDSQKIKDFYQSYMDEAAIEAKGIAPLKGKLDAYAAIADRKALAKAIGGTLRADVDALNNTNFETTNLFGVWVTQGLQDPDHSYPYLMQGGLEMPDRDYYVSSSPQMADLRTKYRAHLEAMFKLAGFSDPAARAKRVFDLETKMAQVHATRTESEEVKNAVLWNRADLAKRAPGLDWTALCEAAGLNDAAAIIAWHPKPIAGLSALAAKEPLEAWKDWLAVHAIENAAPELPRAFVEESFNFFGKALTGVDQQRPRWQRGVDLTNQVLGDAVGRLYADKYFPPETKAKAQAMAADLVKAFGKRIDALTWMSPETKVKAKQKLETLKVGVGYPERWRDYSALEIVKGDPIGNVERADLWEYHHQLAKLHQPVDRGEWWMTPQTVNAVNLPLQNALNFPAAIVQPPYFDANADAAHNYGAMGAVIGHEISHSFDDQGSQFDAQGRMVNWWSPADFEHFKAAGEALAAQFDQYKPFPDLAVNGHQTLSENIADVAGLMDAYDAYQLSLGGKPDVVKDGFTGDQRFFISFGQSWRTEEREVLLRRQIATDGHAPARYRADTVRNLDQWYPAFSVQAAQKLFLAPGERVHVW